MTRTASASVTCPRCNGFRNAFARFGHVAAGQCLLCRGELVVTAAQARAFVAGVMRQDIPRDATCGAEEPETRGAVTRIGTRKTTVGGIPAEIRGYRNDHGGRWFTITTASDVGDLVSTFEIVNGEIVVDGVCNGHISAFGGASGLRKALTAAKR